MTQPSSRTALPNIMEEWRRVAHDWKQKMNRFAILYADRVTIRGKNEANFTTAPHALALSTEQERAARW